MLPRSPFRNREPGPPAAEDGRPLSALLGDVSSYGNLPPPRSCLLLGGPTCSDLSSWESTHLKQDNFEWPSSSRTFCEVHEAFVGPASHLNVFCPILFLSSLLHLRAIPKGHLCLLVCFLENSSAIPCLANATTITIAGTLSLSLPLLYILRCLYS